MSCGNDVLAGVVEFSPINTGGGGTTPIPGSLPLFATAICGLGLLGWRRKRKAVG
jgi:hypothetical protein